MSWRFRTPVARAAIAAALLVLLIAALFGPWGASTELPPVEDVSLPTFLADLDAGAISEVTINATTGIFEVTPTDGEPYELAYPPGYSEKLVDRLLAADIPFTTTRPPAGGTSWFIELIRLAIPLSLIVLLVLFLRRAGIGIGGLGKDKSTPVEVPSIGFASVAGCDEAVEDLREAVQFLRDPERFSALGARVPRGILLVGPPGTGKTLLARSLAGESGVAFFALSGSDFMETYVGVGARRVRDVFSAARKFERGAIIFIDELDTLGKVRGGRTTANPASDEREHTLNQLLVEMDGFSQADHVLVVAATNRPDVLDSALLRPGRFDRRVVVPAPDVKGRQQILELYAQKYTTSDDLDLGALARQTPGLTGADLENLLNEAAIGATRRGGDAIDDSDARQALATIAMGRARRSAVITDWDRTITAYHEAGHALAALKLEGLEAPVEVSIVPRGAAGGATWLEVGDDLFITRSHAQQRLTLLMAGRAGERLLLGGDMTQGASDDLAKATSLATEMVCRWGMGGLGPVSLDADLAVLLGDELVRGAVRGLLDAAAAAADDLVAEHRHALELIAARLIDVETLRRDELLELVA